MFWKRAKKKEAAPAPGKGTALVPFVTSKSAGLQNCVAAAHYTFLRCVTSRRSKGQVLGFGFDFGREPDVK